MLATSIPEHAEIVASDRGTPIASASRPTEGTPMPRRTIDPDTIRKQCEETTRASHGGADMDDCEICRALREGDEARALELIRADPVNRELVRLMSLDDTEFEAWLSSQRETADAAH
jgi:hypothetical protein